MNVKPPMSSRQKCRIPPGETTPPLSPVRHVPVSDAEEGVRLDRFLHGHLPGLPHSAIHRLLRTGQVRVNSRRARGSVRLRIGDEVRLPPVRPTPAKEAKTPPKHLVQAVKNRIIWHDDHLLVLNKPDGMTVHGGSGHTWGAIDAIRHVADHRRGEQADPTLAQTALPGMGQPELCHRLDKSTSGCLLFALNKPALQRMTAMFRQGTIGKHYLALVRGHPHPAKGVIDRPLTKGAIRSGERMVVSEHGGVPARTHYRIIQRFARASLVAIRLESGKTHQVRVHFQSIGHPLAGDQKYGDHAFNTHLKRYGLNRLFLHARSLIFQHPITHIDMVVKAPLAEKLTQTLLSLPALSAR